MKTSTEAAISLTKSLYTNCNSEESWENSNSFQYQECTNQISQSNARIYGSKTAIEIYAANNLFSMVEIQTLLGELMEDVEVSPFGSSGLEAAMNRIKKDSSLSSTVVCSEIVGCAETTRHIVIQLKMIKWGLFGVGEATAGMYLAQHYSRLGTYFGDMDGNEWPHAPLHSVPTPMENNLNNYLTEITKELSGGKLKDVSILDLPSFGSKIAHLQADQMKEPNWPTEMNFAIFKKNMGNISLVFSEYKKLLSLWDQYMKEVSSGVEQPLFSQGMANNTHFNFTQYIQADVETFLKVVSRTPNFVFKGHETLWRRIANKIFKFTKNDDYVSKNGLYDKLVLGCAFKEDLMKKTFSTVDHEDFFYPTLTTNGICHTFNEDDLSKIWRPSNLTIAFKNVFKTGNGQSKKYFGGTGSSQGNYDLKS